MKYKFFWKGKLSNWTKSTFSVNGVEFNCGEQYMMYAKAILFEDHEIAEEILAESNPKEIKALGRKIRNFKGDIWDSVKYKVVKEGLLQRFKQNSDLIKILEKNKGATFVEASPFDRIWGIGYDENHAMDNIDNWGENLLGKVITEIAEELC
jgi:hypothetical protein